MSQLGLFANFALLLGGVSTACLAAAVVLGPRLALAAVRSSVVSGLCFIFMAAAVLAWRVMN